jgi:ABC-type antimicrobial peptide transport system permease subunit
MLKINHEFQPQTRMKWGFLKKVLKIMGKICAFLPVYYTFCSKMPIVVEISMFVAILIAL